jgi:hypothetical protein
LQRSEALIKVLLPDVDVNRPDFDIGRFLPQLQGIVASRIAAAGKEMIGSSTRLPEQDSNASAPALGEKDQLLESMVEAAGRLDIDESGHMDFHGHSSGLAFLAHLNSQFGDLLGEEFTGKTFLKVRSTAFPKEYGTPRSTTSQPDDGTHPNSLLPPRHIAKVLVDACLDDACVLMRFVHRPTFDNMMDRIYNTDAKDYSNAEHDYIPLIYLTLAVGCLFVNDTKDWQVESPVTEG